MLYEDISSGGSDFYEFQAGDNVLRLLTLPELVMEFYSEVDNKSYAYNGEEGIKPKKSYYYYVLDRRDGKVKLARVPSTVVNAIKEYRANAEYKFDDVPSYDITVKKTGVKMDTEYTTIPARANTVLTEAEIAAFAALPPLVGVVEKFRARFRPASEGADSVPTAAFLPSKE